MPRPHLKLLPQLSIWQKRHVKKEKLKQMVAPLRVVALVLVLMQVLVLVRVQVRLRLRVLVRVQVQVLGLRRTLRHPLQPGRGRGKLGRRAWPPPPPTQ
jgi:hypothetical protein